MNNISIIIPCYNEEKNILNTINLLLDSEYKNEDIIIVDWSDNKYTKNILSYLPNIKYFSHKNSSRASSMNLWAKYSKWNILLFLHADSELSLNSFKLLKNLDLNIYNYGWFYKKFKPNSFILNILSFFNNLNLLIFKNLLWDNAIFVSKNIFKEIWWFKNIRLMEDVEISRKLKNIWKIMIIKEFTLTSSRKFKKKGVIITLLYMQYMRILYFLWVNDDILEKKYIEY